MKNDKVAEFKVNMEPFVAEARAKMDEVDELMKRATESSRTMQTMRFVKRSWTWIESFGSGKRFFKIQGSSLQLLISVLSE